MKKYLMLLLALVLGLSACNQKEKEFKVNVSLKNGNDQTVYLQKFVDNAPVIIDSAVITECRSKRRKRRPSDSLCTESEGDARLHAVLCRQ